MKLSQLVAALLACGGLVSVQAIESSMREAAGTPERDFRQLIDMVRAAIGAVVYPSKPVGERWISLTAIYADRAIIELGGRKYQYGYTVTASPSGDQLTLAAPVEVIEQYVPTVPADKTVLREGADTAVFREAQDGSIEVTLIRAGRSGNGNYYPDQALREAAPMFEGVRVFAKSDAEHIAGKGKDVRNLIGGIYGTRYVEGKTPDTGLLVGTFKPIDPADKAVTKMVESVKRGMQGLLGLSIDADAHTKKRRAGKETLREAVKFTKVHSVDLIVEPGAGGGLDRLTEAAADSIPQSNEEGNDMLKQRLLEAIKAKAPQKFAAINVDTITDQELINLHEAVCGTGSDPGTQRVTEAQGDNTPLTRADLQVYEARQAARDRVGAAKLPQASKDRLIAGFAAAGADRLTEAAVTSAITDEGAYVARLSESGVVRVPVFGDGSVQVGDRSVVVREMLDAFFDPAHKDHRNINSFKEAYVEITGDKRVTGLLRDCDTSRMAESLGVMRESIDTATFADALGNSITRRMQVIYTGLAELEAWKQVATWGPVNDFRTVERVRIGGYGNLPAVAQGAPYQALTTPGDDKATYSVTKRGGTEDVTLEAIKNDDIQALRRIPQELAFAAKNTLYEFVFDFYRGNPLIHDGKAMYHVDHANLFAAGLTADEFAKHRLSMRQQTRSGSGKRLATSPAVLLVPGELERTAYDLFTRKTNLDEDFVQSKKTKVIVVDYWLDANDWVTVADPVILPVLEIGFLDGREDPELFVQDAPTVGSMFSHDKLTYKIRHIYGGTVLVDGEKGTTKAVVA